MSASERVLLRGGLSVARAACELALALEAAGVTLRIDGSDIVVDGTVSPAALAELRRWKPDIIQILRYTPDDRHLYDDPSNATRRPVHA